MELTVQKREKLGKASKGLFKQGLIPAEVYGHGFKNEHLAVLGKEFIKVFKEAGENTIVNLNVGGEKWPALIYEVQKGRTLGEVTHVDFYRVTMTEKITTKVPLEFIGESPAVREKLGILNKSMDEIEVEALPADLPRRIEVDLGLLVDLSSNIYVKDLKVSPKVKVLVDPETTVATMVAVKEEEVVKGPTDVSEVKVEVEEKKAERDSEKAEKSKEKEG
ncbi:MAG: 50S ribosomal protein L25 [Patescibacteria group bacterium]